MHPILIALTLLACLGCGLVAGVFFAFSAFVMKGLGGLQAAGGLAAMRSINVAAVSPALMVALFGTAAAALGAAVWAVIGWQGAFSGYLIAGAAVYLAGAIGLTVGYHVPRNEALARPAPGDDARRWNSYRAAWTRANHVRALAALTATALFGLALTAG